VILDEAKRRSIGLVVLVSTATVGAGTLICWSVFRDSLADIVMVFLLGVVIMAVRFGYLASLLTTVLSVAALDFFFTAPYFSFAVADRRLVLTIVIMGFVAWVISNQTERLRRVSREARDRAADAHRAELEVQKERLKNALLSSVSHDLRTPLAVVKGAATALLDGEHDLPKGRRREYLQTISQEANRLNRLVQNLVGMTALEAGPLRVRREWQPLEEVIGVSLNRFGEQLDQERSKFVSRLTRPSSPSTPFCSSRSSSIWWKTPSSTRQPTHESRSRRRRFPEASRWRWRTQDPASLPGRKRPSLISSIGRAPPRAGWGSV
jgi:K+-sensing histidine kinase KdpD